MVYSERNVTSDCSCVRRLITVGHELERWLSCHIDRTVFGGFLPIQNCFQTGNSRCDMKWPDCKASDERRRRPVSYCFFVVLNFPILTPVYPAANELRGLESTRRELCDLCFLGQGLSLFMLNLERWYADRDWKRRARGEETRDACIGWPPSLSQFKNGSSGAKKAIWRFLKCSPESYFLIF